MKTPLLSGFLAPSADSRRWLLAAAMAFFAVGSAQAQAPANDNCTGATALTVAATCTPVTTTNVNATASTGAPAPGTNCFLATTPISNDVWYTAVVPANGALTVTTSAITGSSLNDTGMVVYSGTCSSLTEVGCSDDNTTGLFSTAAMTGLTAGSTVYIRVWSFGTTPTGQFGICATSPTGAICADPTGATLGNVTNTSLQIAFTPGAGNVSYNVTYTAAGGTAQTVTPAPTASPITINGLTAGTFYTITIQSVCAGGATGAVLTGTATTTGGTIPANDDPSGAIVLPVLLTCTPTNGTNAGATTTTPVGYTNPGASCGAAVSPIDVWYRFTTATTGLGSTAVTLTVTGSTAGQVRAFSTTGGAAGPFTQVGCSAGTTNNTVASPLRLTGLTPATTYYVFVSGYGSADAPGPFTICAVGAAPPAGPAYATLPYSEGFEGPWVDVIATRDAPTVNWRNTPSTGDNSWRREDDGFATLSGSSANWRYPDNEMPTAAFPIPPYVTRFSTGAHSARFHTFGAASGLQGSLDLYVNLSGTGSKMLTFDYINPTGTDRLDVLVSTDGGTTFSTTPALTATTNTTFTAKAVTLTSTSATTVIRFRATSDYGDNDIGIDNLQLRLVTATRNEALAATVNLFPNPTHSAFTLNVPAGSLTKASATLSNALGQVVQTRQLSLPAAGGSAEFNVNGLAAGVYSLQLKSGNDLVVKRVVVE